MLETYCYTSAPCFIEFNYFVVSHFELPLGGKIQWERPRGSTTVLHRNKSLSKIVCWWLGGRERA